MLYPVLRDMNNWLDNDFDDMLNTSWMPRMNVTAPAINVKENDKAYEVELAAPGTTKDDFKVNVDKDGCLTIKMEHKDENKKVDKKEHYLRREFSYSNYEQALTLPDDVKRDGIKANVENGVLHVTLPRSAKAEKETKSIEVAELQITCIRNSRDLPIYRSSPFLIIYPYTIHCMDNIL